MEPIAYSKPTVNIELTDSAVVKNYFASTTTISYDSGSGGARSAFTLVDSSVTSAKLAAGI